MSIYDDNIVAIFSVSDIIKIDKKYMVTRKILAELIDNLSSSNSIIMIFDWSFETCLIKYDMKTIGWIVWIGRVVIKVR